MPLAFREPLSISLPQLTRLHIRRALRAMIAEFVFFMGMAAICFSGLLFTLWTLGMFHSTSCCEPSINQQRRRSYAFLNPASGSDSGWTLKGIAWLMVQIWFGNTYLSFGQASSFHPLFGPILMTGFAALSNTLLLTSEYLPSTYCIRTILSDLKCPVLISILSNTFARIDAVGPLRLLT